MFFLNKKTHVCRLRCVPLTIDVRECVEYVLSTLLYRLFPL